MKTCECGSTQFKIQTNYAGYTIVDMTPDGDFDIIDSEHGDGEFLTECPVECRECGKEMPYAEWDNEL